MILTLTLRKLLPLLIYQYRVGYSHWHILDHRHGHGSSYSHGYGLVHGVGHRLSHGVGDTPFHGVGNVLDHWHRIRPGYRNSHGPVYRNCYWL